MTKQEIFNLVVAHLARQGGPARSRQGRCFYRSQMTSRQCAIGHLISDKAYGSDLELLPVRNRLVLDALKNSGVITGVVKDDLVEFLTDLQKAHDTAPVKFRSDDDREGVWADDDDEYRNVSIIWLLADVAVKWGLMFTQKQIVAFKLH